MTRLNIDAKIWAIAWPAIISNISIPLLGLADAALLGHLSDPRHLAAVAVGAAILSFLYWGFSFLRMGTTGEVARAVGDGDDERAFIAMGRAAILAIAIAMVLLVLQRPLVAVGLAIMAPDAQLAGLAANYAQLRLLSAPAVMLTYVIVGWFIGQQNTRWPMVVLIATNLINIALDGLFILGLDMASRGAALATVCAEYTGLALAIFGIARAGQPRPSPAIRRAILDLRRLRAVLASNSELFLRTLTLLFAFAFFTAAGERLGTDIVAANAIMMQFLLFSAFALDGFAYAAEGLAGEALGAGRPDRFHEVSRRCALWSLATAALISMMILLGRPWLFPGLTSLPDVLAVMRAQGIWLVLMPLVAAPSYLLDGLFIGAGATRAMMLTMLLSAGAVYFPVWYLSRAWGNDGLWLAFTLFNAARGISLGACYFMITRQDRWLRWSRGPVA
ncbi:MAG: MATE family efflux transporter [Pseudomonadota bacterium]